MNVVEVAIWLMLFGLSFLIGTVVRLAKSNRELWRRNGQLAHDIRAIKFMAGLDKDSPFEPMWGTFDHEDVLNIRKGSVNGAIPPQRKQGDAE